MKRWNCWLRPSGFAGSSEGSCSLPSAGSRGAELGARCRAGLRRRSALAAAPGGAAPPSCQAAPVRPRFILAGVGAGTTWLFFIGPFPTLRDYGSILRKPPR